MMHELDFEFAFKTLWGLATAGFWFWINALSARLKEFDKRHDDLLHELHEVKLNYQTKADAVANADNISRSLHRIEDKIDKLADRKADK